DQRLMWHADRLLRNSGAEQCGCPSLFVRETRIEPVHQDARVNERGHGRRDLRVSSRVLGTWPGTAYAGEFAVAVWPDRTAPAFPAAPPLGGRLGCRSEWPRQSGAGPTHRRRVFRTGRRELSAA